jgi:subtilase family serine protease
VQNRSGLSIKAFHLTALILLTLSTSAGLAGQTRIPRTIDESRLERIPGSTHPAVRNATDSGRAAPDLAMDRMLLVLKGSADQNAALEALIAAQHDPTSPQFRQWLTPQQFGDRFGPAQANIDTLTAWLQQRGFHVNGVAAGRRSIEFSGTAAQVEQAFHTEIHRYMAGGVRHTANSTDISIPADLSAVVAGIASLNDFAPAPLHRTGAALTAEPNGTHPQLTIKGGGHAIAPGDFATIYNVAPLYAAGIDGTGQAIAVVGRSNFNISDVTSFRSTFGLPANNPQVVLNGPNPGILSEDEEVEALLDTEWSGAIAKGASIRFVLSAGTRTTGGETLSAQYIVDNNLAPILTTSFGQCEAQLGTANQLYNLLWQQAAAQGMSVIVAAGDNGSAGCDDPNNTTPATQGFAVNGLASTPFNTALGGTALNEGTGTYWNATNTATDSSALSYIPETVWNDSSYSRAGSSTNNLAAGSGGVSTLYATPSWQTGSGVPSTDPKSSGHHRYLPDISLSAATHDPYTVMLNGSLIGVGGTSAAAPSFAGVIALLDQHESARTGNPAATLYSLFAKSPSAFHDVVTGTNAVPCSIGSPNCNAVSSSIGTMAGWSAAANYDLASGLGSVNAYNMVMNWPASALAAGPSIGSLTPNPMTGSASPQTLTIGGSGFQSGLKVLLATGGTTATYQGSAILSVSATQIQVSVNVGTAAANWTVQVLNSNGQSSAAASLMVNAPIVAPVLSSLNPNPMTGSNAAQTLTLNGSGFKSGSGLQVQFTSGSSTTTIQSNQINFVSSMELQVSIIVGTTATSYSVKVVNPGGAASAAITLQVNAPPQTAAPVITSLSPGSFPASNSLQLLVIRGTGFQNGSGLKVLIGSGGTTTPVSPSQIFFISSTQLYVFLDLGTAARTVTVQVVDPSGAASNTVSLPVL